MQSLKRALGIWFLSLICTMSSEAFGKKPTPTPTPKPTPATVPFSVLCPIAGYSCPFQPASTIGVCVNKEIICSYNFGAPKDNVCMFAPAAIPCSNPRFSEGSLKECPPSRQIGPADNAFVYGHNSHVPCTSATKAVAMNATCNQVPPPDLQQRLNANCEMVCKSVKKLTGSCPREL